MGNAFQALQLNSCYPRATRLNPIAVHAQSRIPASPTQCHSLNLQSCDSDASKVNPGESLVVFPPSPLRRCPPQSPLHPPVSTMASSQGMVSTLPSPGSLTRYSSASGTNAPRGFSSQGPRSSIFPSSSSDQRRPFPVVQTSDGSRASSVSAYESLPLNLPSNQRIQNASYNATSVSRTPSLLALSYVIGFGVEVIQQIADLIRVQVGRDATKEEILDFSDRVRDGSIVLPPLPVPSQSRRSSSGELLSDADSTHSEDSQSSSDGYDDDDDDDGDETSNFQSLPDNDSVDGSTASLNNQQGASSLDGVDGPLTHQQNPIHFNKLPNIKSDPNRAASLNPDINQTRLTDASSMEPQDSGVGSLPPSGHSETVNAAAPVSPTPQQNNTPSKQLSEKDRQRQVQLILLALQKEFEILDASRKCGKCKLKARDTTFLPCGHFMMCKECSEPVYTCPTCQKPIHATAQTFLS